MGGESCSAQLSGAAKERAAVPDACLERHRVRVDWHVVRASERTLAHARTISTRSRSGEHGFARTVHPAAIAALAVVASSGAISPSTGIRLVDNRVLRRRQNSSPASVSAEQSVRNVWSEERGLRDGLFVALGAFHLETHSDGAVSVLKMEDVASFDDQKTWLNRREHWHKSSVSNNRGVFSADVSRSRPARRHWEVGESNHRNRGRPAISLQSFDRLSIAVIVEHDHVGHRGKRAADNLTGRNS